MSPWRWLKGQLMRLQVVVLLLKSMAVSSVTLGHWTLWWQMSWQVKLMVCSAFSLSSGHSPTLLTRPHPSSRELCRVWLFITISIKTKDSTTHLIASTGSHPSPTVLPRLLPWWLQKSSTNSGLQVWILRPSRTSAFSKPISQQKARYVFSQPSKHTMLSFLSSSEMPAQWLTVPGRNPGLKTTALGFPNNLFGTSATLSRQKGFLFHPFLILSALRMLPPFSHTLRSLHL